MLKPERSGLIDMLISSDDSEEIVKARCHYTRAEVDGIIYDLYYDVHVQGNTVAYEEGVRAQLENKLFLKDATSDLPAVTNSEMRYEMPYGGTPTTEFQHMIRLKRLKRSKPADYIFNPTTRQFALLPLPPNDGKYFTRIQLVFGPLESPRYRVVCTQFFNSELKICVLI